MPKRKNIINISLGESISIFRDQYDTSTDAEQNTLTVVLMTLFNGIKIIVSQYICCCGDNNSTFDFFLLFDASQKCMQGFLSPDTLIVYPDFIT